MRQVIAPVISNIEVIPRTHFVWLDCPPIATEAKPGQFVMVRCGEDCFLPRPLSVHRVDGGKLALLFEIVGKGTEWLAQRKKGDKLDIFGPLGNGFTISADAHNLLLVAGGIGIAPLVFLADGALKKGLAGRLLLGASTASQLYPQDLLPAGIELIATTEDGSAGTRGMITDLLYKYIDWADQLFACGPVGMYRTMAKMPELKNKPVQVSLEVVMGCGMGVCYGCTIKTRKGLKQVCKDGPVFDLKDIIWEEIIGI